MTMKNNYQGTIYACYLAGITQSIIVNFITLLFVIFMEEFSLPLSEITALITVNFLVQLTVDFLAAKFVDKIGYRQCIVAAHVFGTAGLVSLAVLPKLFANPLIGILISVVLYAIGGGLIEVLTSPIVEACPTDNKAAVMSLLHSFYCWGTVAVILLTTLFFQVFGADKWQILACLWALIPAFNVFLFAKVPIRTLTGEGEGMTMRALFSKKTFWLFVVIMIMAGASELSMSQWASAFAERGLGVSKTVGDLAGPCVFAIMMGSARVFFSKMSEKIDLLSFLIGSGCLAVVSYLIAALSPIPVFSLIGCGLCGLAVGILWPGVFSVAAAKFPLGGTAMFGLLALSGDIGCTVGPTVVGTVSDAFGGDLKSGMFFGIVFPIVFVICTCIYRRSQNREKNAPQKDKS